MVRILWFKETTRWSAGKLISPLQQRICNGAACAVSGDGGVSGTIRIDGDQLVFEIHGIDEILSIKRSISVPLEHVQSVSTGDPGWAPRSPYYPPGGTGDACTSRSGIARRGRR